MSSTKYLLSKFDESIQAAVSDITAPIQGLFVVDVPDGVQVSDPTDYTDLKTQKHDGILAVFADFTDQVYDEFDTTTGINTGATGHFAHIGKWEVRLPPVSGQVTTVAEALGSTPSQCNLYWSCYTLTRTANATGGYDITYTEVDPDELDVTVSVDGGSNYDTVTHATSYTPANPGTSLIIKFANTTANHVWVGYYSFLYR